MKTKYYQNGSAYLAVTSKGNFLITPALIQKTEQQPGEGMTEITPDVTLQGIVENAVVNTPNILTVGEAKIFQTLVDDSIQAAAEE